MGWSCTAKASQTLDKMADKCHANSGITNVWKDAKGKYMFETSRREHDDGHITGTIWKFFTEEGHVKKSGSLYINPDGTIRNAPKFLKDIPQEHIYHSFELI